MLESLFFIFLRLKFIQHFATFFLWRTKTLTDSLASTFNSKNKISSQRLPRKHGFQRPLENIFTFYLFVSEKITLNSFFFVLDDYKFHDMIWVGYLASIVLKKDIKTRQYRLAFKRKSFSGILILHMSLSYHKLFTTSGEKSE